MVKKVVRVNYSESEAGILVPNGFHERKSGIYKGESFLKTKEKAIAVENLYSKLGIKIPQGSGLATLISSAKKLSDCWLMDEIGKLHADDQWSAIHLSRVSSAVLGVQNDSQIETHLKKLASGNLNLFTHERSEAKDFLWELELLQLLRYYGIDAHLQEPPDIVCSFEGAEIGVACKKVYSEKHFESVLSKGVNQIEKEFEFGMVAINLDALAPEKSVLKTKTVREANDIIADINFGFLKRQERKLKKYLSCGRIQGAIVSVSLIADVKEQPAISNQRQSSCWTVPGLPEDKQRAWEKFYNQIMK